MPTSQSQQSPLRRWAANLPGARSTWQLGRTLLDVWHDSSRYSQVELQQDFTHQDPWNYATDTLQVRRHTGEIAMIDRLGSTHFDHVLELGCAEGIFTELLESRSQSLVATDFYSVVLERARQRRTWGNHVQFTCLDLRAEPLPGTFDLIVAIHVLEYVQSPFPLHRIREKIVQALRPGGHLFLGCVAFNATNENSWWSRYLLRGGRNINNYFIAHPQLTLVDSAVFPLTECDSLDIVLRKA